MEMEVIINWNGKYRRDFGIFLLFALHLYNGRCILIIKKSILKSKARIKNPRSNSSKNKKPIHKKMNILPSKLKSNPKKKSGTSNKTKKSREESLTYVNSKNKKINGKWRSIHYYKDSKGKKHQKMVRDYRKEQEINQPGKLLNGRKTMIKHLPPDIMKGLKKVARDKFEHSIALDFERRDTQPQRVVIMKGGEAETIKIEDFEFFGHTHPNRKTPDPSFADISSMKTLEPEFIIAGKTGKTTILNVEAPEKLRKHIFKRKVPRGNSTAIEQKDIEHQKKRKKYKDDPLLKNITPYNITETARGRELFFDITGIKLYPLKEKATYVEMKNDPVKEKAVPTIPKEYLEKYQRGRYVER